MLSIFMRLDLAGLAVLRYVEYGRNVCIVSYRVPVPNEHHLIIEFQMTFAILYPVSWPLIKTLPR